MKSLEEYSAQAGWFESARYDNGVPVAQVAIYNEYGTSRIPPRPFMRPTVESQKQEWARATGKVVSQVLRGKMSAEQGMTLVAQKAAGDIRQTISRVDSPPLSPITLLLRQWRKEGKEITGRTVGEAARAVHRGERAEGVSTQPLNDTGYMIATLTGLAVKK
nr:MAG TPA: virion morphogenesis protein [Caudoviricetes sp.]